MCVLVSSVVMASTSRAVLVALWLLDYDVTMTLQNSCGCYSILVVVTAKISGG